MHTKTSKITCLHLLLFFCWLHVFVGTKLLPSVLQFLYHAWITDPKAALKARGKEKRKFWKKYTRGVRHRKSKKDGKLTKKNHTLILLPRSSNHCKFSFLYFSGSCSCRCWWAFWWARKRRGEQEVWWSWWVSPQEISFEILNKRMT